MLTISHSEAETAHSCQLKWSFRYGRGLKPLTTAYRLRRGRGWGIAVADYHRCFDQIDPLAMARNTLTEALADEWKKTFPDGAFQHVPMEAEVEARELHAELDALLVHYAKFQPPLGAHDLERKYLVGVPGLRGAETGRAARLDVRIDLMQRDEHGLWLVEHKLREDLTPFKLITRSRQWRWYAYAHKRAGGEPIVGVIVDERRAVLPSEPMLLKNGSVSRDKAKRVDPDEYLAACRDAGHEPDEEALAAYRARIWQERHHIFLSDLELVEAGRQIASSARLITCRLSDKNW